MRRDSWIEVFSEKFILAGSWLVTMVSIWKRSERNFRSWVPDALVSAVVGTMDANVPFSLPEERIA